MSVNQSRIKQVIKNAWKATRLGPGWEARLDKNLLDGFAELLKGEGPEVDFARQLTDIRDTARTGLPATGMTEEQWAKHRLNVIAGDLTRLIVWLDDSELKL